MRSDTRKARIVAAFAALLIVALGAGCRGFFVNPTVTGIQVGPSASLQQNKTIQESATATYSDNSTPKNITSGVVWSIADTSGTNVATISASGLVTAINPGTATVTGSVGSVSGTATITVTLANLTSIQITPQSTSITSGNSQQYVAMANGGSTVITDSVNWAVNAGSVTGVSINSSGLLTTSSGQTGTVTVTATDPSTGIVSNTATLTIN
jgi:hypothetical protein